MWKRLLGTPNRWCLGGPKTAKIRMSSAFLFSHIPAAKISPRPRNIANMLSVAALVGVVLFGVSRKEPVPYLGKLKNG